MRRAAGTAVAALVLVGGGSVVAPAAHAAPLHELTSFSQSYIDPAGIVAMTLSFNGTGLTGATTMLIDGVQVPGFVVDTDTGGRMELPLLPPGPKDVTLRFPDGDIVVPGLITYLPEPSISSISPATTSAAGGEVLTLHGAGFAPNADVRVGSSSTNVTYVSSTEVTIISPGYPVGPVSITFKNAWWGAQTVVMDGLLTIVPGLYPINPDPAQIDLPYDFSLDANWSPGFEFDLGGTASLTGLPTGITAILVPATPEPGRSPVMHLTGTATALSSNTLTWSVTDEHGASASRTLSFSVIEQLIPKPTIDPMTQGEPFDQTLSVPDGLSAWDWTWGGDTSVDGLPDGLTAEVLDTWTNGVAPSVRITGTPTLAGIYTFTWWVSDDNISTTIPFTVEVGPFLNYVFTATPGTIPVGGSTTVTYTGGSGRFSAEFMGDVTTAISCGNLDSYGETTVMPWSAFGGSTQRVVRIRTYDVLFTHQACPTMSDPFAKEIVLTFAAKATTPPVVGSKAPKAPTGVTLRLLPGGHSRIAWTASTGATGYRAYVNGKFACSTSTRGRYCDVDRILGPSAVVHVVAFGAGGTKSLAGVGRYLKPTSSMLLGTIPFVGTSSSLTADAKAQLSALARLITAQGFTRIEVDGFTARSAGASSAASEAFRLRLSQARAVAVTLYLRGLLDGPTVAAVGKAAANPVGSNLTPEGRALNRRAEVRTY
jgi:outer membrane protein OmpA-like peptidoglycan-associated protein